MIESIQLALQAIKGGLDVAQGAQAFKTETAVAQAIIDMQRSLLEAYRGLNDAEARHAEDLARIRELEQQIIGFKDWSVERERYEPVDIYLGSIAYMLKLGTESGEPPHWLCPNCFQLGRKSFLIFKGQDKGPGGSRGDESTWGCDSCKLSLKVSYRATPEAVQRKRLATAADSSPSA